MNITILVNSCDAYSDLWEPFFALLKLRWKNIGEYEILLNTESKSFQMEGLNIKKVELVNKDCSTWSKRFRKALSQVKTKYVLILLDDFFLEKKVDEERLIAISKIMEENNNIMNFSFVPTWWKNLNDSSFSGFELRDKKARYLVNLQAGLWRTRQLKSLIRSHESPWEFEEFATLRASYRKGDYYIAKEGEAQVFSYNWKQGGALHRGKWTKGVEELLKEVNVSIDYTQRGWDSNYVIFSEETQIEKKTFYKKQKERLIAIKKHWRSLI